MAKYDFSQKSLDEFELTYTNKDGKEVVLPFKRTIEIAKRIQDVSANSRLAMFKYLKDKGMTKQDLVVERKENGKTIVDESNYLEFEQDFLKQEQAKMINDIIVELFHKSFLELLPDMGITEEKDAQKFGTQLRNVLVVGMGDKSQIPSGDDLEQLSV